MSRKVFLSFLGTNPYTECNYYEENNKNIRVSNVNFIQTALIKLYCKDFTKDDRIFIFLTSDAKSKNWENNGNFTIGLKERLYKLNLGKIIEVNYDESDIWGMFNKMYEVLEDKDDIIFDVTHSFRYIPMLAMVMFNYAKFLKDINLKAIHYGAFERLGNYNIVSKMNIEDRNAPILNLIAFDELQQWSVGADNFVNYGNAEKIINILDNRVKELARSLSISNNKQEIIIEKEKISKFKGSLELFYKSINTNNLSEINSSKIIKQLKTNLLSIKNSNSNYQALTPILKKIEEKISFFNDKEDILNGFKAVDWCIKHNLIQQGITMLQENIITSLINGIENGLSTDEILRADISSMLNLKAQKIKKENINLKNDSNIILYDKFEMELCRIYDKLTKIRNKINHANTKKNEQEAKSYIDSIETLKSEFKNVLIILNLDLKETIE